MLTAEEALREWERDPDKQVWSRAIVAALARALVPLLRPEPVTEERSDKPEL